MPNSRAPRPSILYRRSPHVVCYWSGDRLIFENYLTHRRARANPLTFEVLRVFDRWRPASALDARFPRFSAAARRKAIAALERFTLLERRGRSPASASLEHALRSWRDWSPAAALIHSSARDGTARTDLEELTRRLRKRAKALPMPSAVKRYPAARQICLPPPETRGDFPRALLARRTWRKFDRQPIDLGSLATLLGLTWGTHAWLDFPGLGKLALKTSPSAGARHAMEVYVLALRVRGLPRGLYHYAPDVHRLEQLRGGSSPAQATAFLAGQHWFGSAAAVLFMTAVFRRVQWKYRSPRAYLTLFLDAGHLCQTFCLVATWLGLAPFCTMALANSKIERALGIHGLTESAIYAAGVGARPRGVEWAPWPGRPFGRRFPNPVFARENGGGVQPASTRSNAAGFGRNPH